MLETPSIPTSELLEAFAYGEHLEGSQKRSLGFRLIVPEIPQRWSSEVESLARRLQSAPYPDHWPVIDLCCSVLLADGQRLVAVARYGLDDHTPSRRRGGLELIGVIGTNSISVTAALAIFQWLRQRRDSVEDIRVLSGRFDLVEVLAEAPAPPPVGDPVPVLPIRLWEEGALLFAATAPSDPNTRLGMLEHSSNSNWQWLPLTGPDFPISLYAQRGPLVAWTPHLTGVAVKLDQPAISPSGYLPPQRSRFGMVLLVLLVLGLLGANLWWIWRLDQRVSALSQSKESASTSATTPTIPKTDSVKTPSDEVDILGQQLYAYMLDKGILKENRRDNLLQNYDRLVADHPQLKVLSSESKIALGMMIELGKRKSPLQIESMIRNLGNQTKGLDSDVLNLIAQKVYQKLTEAE